MSSFEAVIRSPPSFDNMYLVGKIKHLSYVSSKTIFHSNQKKKEKLHVMRESFILQKYAPY